VHRRKMVAILQFIVPDNEKGKKRRSTCTNKVAVIWLDYHRFV
jgi:hypothetical protein